MPVPAPVLYSGRDQLGALFRHRPLEHQRHQEKQTGGQIGDEEARAGLQRAGERLQFVDPGCHFTDPSSPRRVSRVSEDGCRVRGVSMSRFSMQVLTVCLLLMAQIPAVRATPLERQVDAYVAPMVATHSFSGVVLVARGDHVLAKRAYGLASQELAAPNRIDSKFQLASASKPITAAAVLKLV